MSATQSLRCSPSAVRNAPAIAAVLADTLDPGMQVVEVGCGSGQHAAHMVDSIEGLVWQPTDRLPERDTIDGWRELARNKDSILNPRELDVCVPEHWTGLAPFDVVYTANTLHIMSWDACVDLFAGAARCISAGGLMCIYGPFHESGQATSDSNASFDDDLRSRPGAMGIRNLQHVRALAARNNWLESAHFYMPANNQMLIWRQHS